jgi:hypothetical protein
VVTYPRTCLQQQQNDLRYGKLRYVGVVQWHFLIEHTYRIGVYLLLRCVSKNLHHENKCLKGVRPCLQALLTTPNLIVNYFRDIFNPINNACTYDDHKLGEVRFCCWCFIIELLPQQNIQDAYVFNRRWRTRN